MPLAYAGWWVTGLILWFVERRDSAIRFHAAQSMAAFGIVAGVVAWPSARWRVASLSLLPAAFDLFLWAALVTWVAGCRAVDCRDVESGDRARVAHPDRR